MFQQFILERESMKLTEKHVETSDDEAGNFNARSIKLKITHNFLTFTNDNQHCAEGEGGVMINTFPVDSRSVNVHT